MVTSTLSGLREVRVCSEGLEAPLLRGDRSGRLPFALVLLLMARGDFVAAVESLSRAIAINQTPAALEKREQCYRHIGLFAKAEEDHRAIDALNGHASPQQPAQ